MMKTKRMVVEDCEILDSNRSTQELQRALASQESVPRFSHTPCNFHGERRWLLCPTCSRRVVKLYRPSLWHIFACRTCHDLTYRSSQQHDARLDRLLKVPLDVLNEAIRSRNVKRALLAIKATYIRAGIIEKYEPL